jgi:hypothetical protein
MLEEPRYTLAEVADATDVSVATIRSWFQRKHMKLGLTDASMGTGIARKVTLPTALAIAVTGELVSKFGLHPRRAALAAATFSYVGAPDPETGIERDPGHLWLGPEVTNTVLVILADDPDGSSSSVLRVPLNMLFSDIFDAGLFGQYGARYAIVVELNDLVHQVRGRLGLPPDFGDEAPRFSPRTDV